MTTASVPTLTDGDWEKAAHASAVPLVVGFWADWCIPSRMQTPAIESAAHTYNSRLRFALVDYDQSPALVARHAIQGLPTILVLREGEEVERRVGLMGRGSLVELLKKHAVTSGAAAGPPP